MGKKDHAAACSVSVIAVPTRPSSLIEVYWRPGCRFCSGLRRGLRRAEVEATWRNIWSDELAREFVRSVNHGNETVPTVLVGGKVLTNPRPGQVVAAAREVNLLSPSTSTAGSPQLAWSSPREGMALFLRGVTVATAGRVALVVGTLLSLVNQGSAISGGHAGLATWVRVAVNFATPFVVASIGFLSGSRVERGRR